MDWNLIETDDDISNFEFPNSEKVLCLTFLKVKILLLIDITSSPGQKFEYFLELKGL